MKYLIFATFLLFLSSCSKSLIYNTGLNLPTQILQKGDFDIQDNIGLFPEARPEAYPYDKKNTTIGGSLQIQYGISNSFGMALKGWADLEQRENFFRSGIELSAHFNHLFSTRSHLIVIPHIGYASGKSNGGYGLGTTAAYHTQVSDVFAYYTAIGFTWGRADSERKKNAYGESRIPAGIALHGNLGISYNLIPNLRLNAEINPIEQFNTFDKTKQLFLAPQVGMGYTF